MTARSKKVIDYAALGGDSDDDFSSPQSPVLQKKKSKLSKKKSENSKKVYTSTQLDQAEPPIGRGGRPARRQPDELQFEKDLEEALKVSESSMTESSGEILPKNPQSALGASSAETLLLDQENIPIEDNEHGDFADNKRTFNENQDKITKIIRDKINNDDSDDDFTPARTIKKAAVISSDDDDFEVKPSNKQIESAVPKSHMKKTAKTPVASNSTVNKKRKIDDGWVVSTNKKKATNLKKDLKPLESSDDEFEESIRKSKPPPKIIPSRKSKTKATVMKESEQSASEDRADEKISNSKKRVASIRQTKYDGVSDFEESSDSEDSDDDFDPEENNKKKTPLKKSVVKKTPAKTTPTVQVKKTTPSQIEKLTSPPVSKSPIKSYNSPVKSAKSPVKPLGLHNVPENKPAAKTPVSSHLKLARTPSSLTRTPLHFSGPKLAKTPSNHLHKVVSSHLEASSPIVAKPLQTPSPMGARPKLITKIPSWTPPARIGQASLSAGMSQSPSLGLRVGLSRNMKFSKPLHNKVKPQ